MAFNVFLKLARPMIVRRVPLSKDNLDAAPRSARVAENASGREGVSGRAVVGRREPHPLFKTPETDTNRTIPSFPAYEPLYALTPLIDEDNAASVSSMERGLHCAYIVVASRWIVASWSDSTANSLASKPSHSRARTTSRRTVCVGSSTERAHSRSNYRLRTVKGERVAQIRTSRDLSRRAVVDDGATRSARCDESFPEPLEREFLTLVEMTCVEPDDVGVRISAFASSTKNISFVTESDDASKTARTSLFLRRPPASRALRSVRARRACVCAPRTRLSTARR